MMWDIRLENVESMMLDKGKWSPVLGTRIRYRKLGSKGRFGSFVVINGLRGADPQSFVAKYVEQVNKERAAGAAMRANVRRAR